MSKKLLAVVLTLALLVGGVAIGIHVLHKPALAQVTYTVQIWDETEDEWVDDGIVWFSFDQEGELWVEATFTQEGKYIYQVADYQPYWWIELRDPHIFGPNPIEGPATVAYYYWEVETRLE